jgi:hypothetical protein
MSATNHCYTCNEVNLWFVFYVIFNFHKFFYQNKEYDCKVKIKYFTYWQTHFFVIGSCTCISLRGQAESYDYLRNPRDTKTTKQTGRKHKGGRGEPPPQLPIRLCLSREIHPRKGCQQRVGEAVVAKHPPVESTASIRKRLGSRCGEHDIHPQATR